MQESTYSCRVGLFCLCAVLAGCVLSGCVSETPFEMFAQARYAEAQKGIEPMTPKNDTHQDYTLYKAWHSLAAFEGGNYYTALQDIALIRKRMEEVGGDREAAAVAWSEYSKMYRGDPFERCMAHIYGGLLALMDEDFETVLASSRQALVADQETRTKEESEKEDFVAGHYFAALAYSRLGEEDNAEIHLNKAASFAGANELFTLDSLDKANTVFYVETGSGPVKQCYGPGNSMVQYVKMYDPVYRVEIDCDGQSMGSAVIMDDLYAQASCHGWGEMDSARLGKGVTKEIVACIPVFGAFHNLIRSEADVRIWTFLPAKTLVWAGKIKPGMHTITLRCYSAAGKRLPTCDQVWSYVPTSPEQLNVACFRIVPYRQNIHDKVLVPCTALSKKR